MSKLRSSRRIRFSHIFGLLLLVLAGFLVREITKGRIQPRAVEKVRPGFKTIDGDTFTDSQGNTIRLLGIDTPEKGQPLAGEAEVELQALLASGSNIRYEYGPERTDRYQRTLAFVYVDTIFVNERLLEDGLATAYFFEGQLASAVYEELCNAQRSALTNRIGIWADADQETDTVYYGNADRRRFHRSSCSAVTRGEIKHLIRREKREEFLQDCFSPCRNCKP